MTAQLVLPLTAETAGATPAGGITPTVADVDRAACEAIRAIARLAVMVPREEQGVVWAAGMNIGAVAQRVADQADLGTKG